MKNHPLNAGAGVISAVRATAVAAAMLTMSGATFAQDASASADPATVAVEAQEPVSEASLATELRPGVISTTPLEVTEKKLADQEERKAKADALNELQGTNTAVGAAAMSKMLNGPGALVAATAAESVPWALNSETRPWPLRAVPELLIPGMVISLPPSKDMRMMLPGVVKDRIAGVKFTITKYQTDIASEVAFAHGRAEQEFKAWKAAVQNQAKNLDPDDAWQQYQYALELRAITKAYKDAYTAYSEAIGPRLQVEFNTAVERISAVMNESEAHDIQMGWYELLVHLKDGFTILQQQIAENSQSFISEIEPIEVQFPLLPAPDVPKPLTEVERQAKQRAEIQSAAFAQQAQVQVERKKAQELQEEATANTVSGVIVVIAGFLVAIGGFFMLRKRKKAKAAQA